VLYKLLTYLLTYEKFICMAMLVVHVLNCTTAKCAIIKHAILMGSSSSGGARVLLLDVSK